MCVHVKIHINKDSLYSYSCAYIYIYISHCPSKRPEKRSRTNVLPFQNPAKSDVATARGLNRRCLPWSCLGVRPKKEGALHRDLILVNISHLHLHTAISVYDMYIIYIYINVRNLSKSFNIDSLQLCVYIHTYTCTAHVDICYKSFFVVAPRHSGQWPPAPVELPGHFPPRVPQCCHPTPAPAAWPNGQTIFGW